jgi:hypothetical protein
MFECLIACSECGASGPRLSFGNGTVGTGSYKKVSYAGTPRPVRTFPETIESYTSPIASRFWTG